MQCRFGAKKIYQLSAALQYATAVGKSSQQQLGQIHHSMCTHDAPFRASAVCASCLKIPRKSMRSNAQQGKTLNSFEHKSCFL